MIQRLAVVTTEVLPPFSSPCAGGGVRIWGLAQTLQRQGISCTFFLDERIPAEIKTNDNIPIRRFKPELLHSNLTPSEFDAVLFEQWQPLTFIKTDLDIPILVDLPGPLILEYYWRDRENFHQHIVDKVNCLARADYFLCALERQTGYYTAWLTWAGVSPDEPKLIIVPFTLHEMPRSRQGHVEDEPLFFWGGMFWPWQERTSAFHTILATLTQTRRGQLVIVGINPPSTHSSLDLPTYADHPHVSFLGALPFSEYVAELKRAHVAVDLCRPTEERRLASDLRTGTALWAGTPCLVTPDSPWAQMISAHNAGWIVSYGDEKSLRNLIKEIALEQGDMMAKRRGAQAISAIISSDERINALKKILENPVSRKKNPPFFAARFQEQEQRLKTLMEEVNLLKHENAALQHDLDSIRSNPLFRLYKQLSRWKK